MFFTSRLLARTPFYYGWVVAGAVGVSMGLTGLFAAPTFSIFIEPWTTEFGWSRTAISGAFSAATIVAALVGPAVGRGLDRHGGRLILGIGGLLMAGSVGGMALVQDLVVLYLVLSVGRAAMLSVQNLGSHTVIANWFIRRRALATAIVQIGNRLGLGLWPLLAASILAVHGWRSALWVMAAAAAIIAIAPLLFIAARRPEDVGLEPDGRPYSPRAAVTPSVPPQTASSRPGAAAPVRPDVSSGPVDRPEGRKELEEYPWTPREAVRTRGFWLLMLAHMALMVAGGGFGIHRIPYFLGKGMPDTLVGPALLVFAVGMSAGGFLGAWASNRWPQRKTLTAFALAAGLAMFIALAVPGNALAIGFILLEGIAFGGCFAVLPVTFADYFGRTSIGTIRGLTHPAVVAANAVGPILGGVIYDTRAGDYSLAFVIYGLIVGAGAIAAWLARPPTPPGEGRG